MISTYSYHEICPEMLKLRDILDEMNIDWEDDSDPITPDAIDWRIFKTLDSVNCRIYRTHFDYNSNHYSVIYGFGTYGGWNRFSEKEDPKLLELMINDDEPTGYHTAEDIIDIMKERENSI